MCICCVAGERSLVGSPAKLSQLAPAQSRSENRNLPWTAGDADALAVIERQLSRYSRTMLSSLGAADGHRLDTKALTCTADLPRGVLISQLIDEISRFSAARQRVSPIRSGTTTTGPFYELDSQYARLRRAETS